jgi:hypothetical protein
VTTANFQPNATGENNATATFERGGRLQWLGVPDFPADRTATRQLKPMPGSSEWWISILVNRSGWTSSAANTYIVGGFTDSSGDGLQVGYDDQLTNDSVPDLVVRVGGANRVIEVDAPANSSRWILIQLLVNESGNDTVSIWNNPSAVDPLGPADIVWVDVNVSDSSSPFTQSKYESPGQSGVAYFDEVRLATSLDGILGDTAAGTEQYIEADSDAPASVTYWFEVPVDGVYEVYAFQEIAPGLSTNAQYVAVDANGVSFTNHVDQTDAANARWLKLGDVVLGAGRQAVLGVSNEGLANGQLVRAGEAMILLNRRLSRIPELEVLSDPAEIEGGDFRFAVLGNIGQLIGMEWSTNSVDWMDAGQVLISNGMALFQDSVGPGEAARYYRGRLNSTD